MSRTTYAIEERAVSGNIEVGPQGKGWKEDIAYTPEARNKVQAVCGVASGGLALPANDNAPVAAAAGLRFLSVCSGIEAASVAWHPLGWRAVVFAEIEKFPSAVLTHHYPDVPNLGDFTKINTGTLGRIDILAGGTPCQAFSVAGLRKGLDDARGNLTIKFVELAHALADGNGLRNVVWENVVGVLSDKGNAFGCFLAGLVGADTAISPPSRGKWPTHGMVAGPKGRAAWAVKDAQYFGVAQRRRRVLVVADFGNGADPAAVLFEPESVCRNSPPSRQEGKGVAPTISARTKGGGGLGTDFDLDGGIVSCPLLAKGNSSHDATKETYVPDVARCVAKREGSSQDYETTTMVAVSVTGATSHALTAEGADASEDGTGRGTPVIAYAADVAPNMVTSGDAHTGFRDEQGLVAHSVNIRGRDGGSTPELGGEVATALRASQGGGDKQHILTEVRPINMQVGLRHQALGERTGLGAGNEGDPSFTLSKSHSHAVQVSSHVRRLTPIECKRLQGFPDNYTAIPWRGKPEDQCPDGPRYKALGNSWAVPKFVWLGKRIQMLMPANDNRERSYIDKLAA